MMKRNRLYTVNNWNRKLFWPGGSLGNFGSLGSQVGNIAGQDNSNLFKIDTGTNYGNVGQRWDAITSNALGGNPVSTGLPQGFQTSNPNQVNFGTGAASLYSNPAVPTNTGQLNIGTGAQGAKVNGDGTSKVGTIIGTVSGATQGIAAAMSGDPMSVKDRAFNGKKPAYSADAHNGFNVVDTILTGGKKSRVGTALVNTGATVMNKFGSTGVGALVGGILGTAGTIINNGWGYKVDEKALADAERGTNALNNFKSDASYYDDIQGPQAYADVQDVYKGGVFTGDKAKEWNEDLKKERENAESFAYRSVGNNVGNINNRQLENALRWWSSPDFGKNQSAFGGPLDIMGDNDMGAVNYGFMTDYLNEKKRQNDLKNKMGGMNQMPAFMSNGYALGGDLQMHGGDYTTGLTHISAGGLHEENPYEGVQMGVDREGTPNLVEEGETVYNDYVFSNRITCDADTKKKFHIGKNRDITYAELSKKLEKEISERPNDPISKAAFEAQMASLAENQERQKAEMEAARAREAFEALTPEEQAALMQQAAQQEQMAQEQAMQEQAMAEQAAMQQPTPEEIAMAQQQQAMADGTEAALGQEPQMNCFGGRINRFDNGGQAYTKMLNSLGFHTQKEFDDWAKENNIDFGDLWKDNPNILSIDILGKLWSNDNFKKALKAKNPAMAHAFETMGYDFGTYQPENNGKATIQSISKGNWKTTNGKGWRGSEDLAFKQATKGMSDAEIDALTTEQLAERMRNTDAYKNTNQWLQNGDNALMYLNTLLNDPDTPQVAKDYAAKFVKDGKWKDGFNYDYATVFGSNGKGVRETNPGTYWHTAMEANRGNKVANFIINDDGSIEPIVGAVPTDWAAAGNYNWADESNDYTYNYYKRPAVAAAVKPEVAKTPEEKAAEEEKGKNLAPKRNWEGWRYAGLFGPAVGLGMQMMGIGKPDTSGIEAAANAGNGPAHLASYQPIGDYMAPKVFDRLFYANQLQANARATDRNLMNTSSGNRGTAMAGLLANGYNTNNNLGNLYRQAEEYNDNRYKQMKEFNRGTNMFNAEAYNKTSQFNADALNRQRQYGAQLAMQAAREKMDADAGWYNGIYGNISGLMKGIGDLGRENAQRNMIADMAANGIFGQMTPSTYVANGMLRYETDEERAKRLANQKKSAAKGGKIKRKKRGLTY